MRRLLPKLRLKNRVKFELQTGGWLSVLIISSATFVLGLNLWRVAVNAKDSFEVYLFEQQSLEELQDLNQQLKDELEYYSSYEYKKLYARDNLRLGESNERLYRVLKSQEYFQPDAKDPDFFQEGDYAKWWLELI